VPAFYSQENADSWDSKRQVIEEVESAAPTALIPELRTLLGAFLFRGDDVFKSVSVLSGGEKSRLALLMLLLRPANLLILDEPTNHLDIASKDVLLDALRGFPGTVIFVSHDRHFISHLATAVLEVKGGGARFLPGDYDYYLRRVAQERQAEADAPPVAAETRAATATQLERREEKRLKSELRSLEREEAELMQGLESLEGSRREIEETMALPEVYADGERMKALRRRHQENQALHGESMTRWERVDARLRELKEKISRAGW
jgi:ATP-binding cassette subfamily F protein 3